MCVRQSSKLIQFSIVHVTTEGEWRKKESHSHRIQYVKKIFEFTKKNNIYTTRTTVWKCAFFRNNTLINMPSPRVFQRTKSYANEMYRVRQTQHLFVIRVNYVRRKSIALSHKRKYLFALFLSVLGIDISNRKYEINQRSRCIKDKLICLLVVF